MTPVPAAITPSTLRFRAWEAARAPRPKSGDFARRTLNVVVAAAGIALTLPLMLAIALSVKLTSKGPVIFRQPRVGLDRRLYRPSAGGNDRRTGNRGGRIFTIYKFRTMRVQQPGSPQRWASRERFRITPIGAFLRAFRLDELPQLFNVLKGDMNIVGPRPEQPEIFRSLREEVGRYQKRQAVLPGITGLAQVSLAYDRSVDDVKRKVELDLEYIRRCSPGQDLLIMAKTMPVMAFRKGSM